MFTKLLAFTIAAVAMASATQGRPLTAKDLVSLDRVSDPRLSPDGEMVAYDLRVTDYDANRSTHALWLVDTRGGPARRLEAAGAEANSAQWSPDGRRVYFLSGRGGSDQVWRANVGGGKSEQVTHLPLDVQNFRIAPDGRLLVLAMAVFPDAEDPAATKARLDVAKTTKASGALYDHLFVRHWDTWADGRRNHLFAVTLDATGVAGSPTPLMAGFDGDSPVKPFGGEDDFTISLDSRTVVFSAELAGRTESWSTNFDLWSAPLDGSAPPRDLTSANPAADVHPVFSPDGHTLAYLAQKRPGFESDRFGVWLMDLNTGASHEVAPNWDRSAGGLKWSADGRSLLVTAEEVQHARLFSLDAADGKVTRIETGDGSVGDVEAGSRGLVFTKDGLLGPTQIFASNGGGVRALTHADTEKLTGVEMAPWTPFTFAGWNGETVHGIVVEPRGWKPGVKYPVVYLIHGGPQGSFGDSWSYRWNPQVWSGWGYAVVMVDFHGSTGYGQAFTDAISKHWGDRPLEDLQKGWTAALAKFDYLDGNRACAAGASYGGYMIYWMAGHWNKPWRCLIDHDGVFDNRIMGYATEELWFSEWENSETPWQNPAGYERFNPVNAVADWTKPMLIIHSAKDYRIPLEQGLGAFTALQRKGVPSQFLTFPDENHWVLKPQNSVEWHATVEAWLNRWTAN